MAMNVSELYQRQIENILQTYPMVDQEISCRSVLEYCRPYMKQICQEEPEDWLEYLYNYFLSIYFPENFEKFGMAKWEEAGLFYVSVLEGLFKEERKVLPFDRCKDFAYLSEEEMKDCEIKDEFNRFLQTYKDLHIYAFFRIAREYTPFDTLGHIAGVHNVAMYMARQIKQTDIPVDLGLVSSTAILHDIGKFGCRGKENRRVPYLHYYYTDIFSRRFRFPVIGHIAANHSTWDLEFENLSLENLLLIYADFRVKSSRIEGREVVQFYSLKESYDVILGKLDNVDDKKRNRYRKVYTKLKDFEDFLVRCGVSTDLRAPFHPIKQEKNYSLLDRAKQIQVYKDMAIGSNVRVMNMMNYDSKFTDFLEEIRSEKNWRNIRAYLNVLEEYSTYMTLRQKDEVLDYLYEMQTHREGDIRRQASSIMGQIIARYEVAYTKELPEGARRPEIGKTKQEVWAEQLERMLVPHHKLTSRESRWVGFAMQTVYETVMKRVPEKERQEVLSVLLGYYKLDETDDVRQFILMNTAEDICLSICDEKARCTLGSFALKSLGSSSEEIEAAALRFTLGWLRQGWKDNEERTTELRTRIEQAPDRGTLALKYLKSEILTLLADKTENPLMEEIVNDDIARLYQENQKMDTLWIHKITNLEIMRRYCMKKPDLLFQLGAHLLNMLKTSDRIVVRLETGRVLTQIIPFMTIAERYEIAVELVRGLEIGEDSVSKYIPQFLGEIFFYLPAQAQEEVLTRFYEMISGKNERIGIVALETIGYTAQHVFEHIRMKPDMEEYFLKHKERLEGLLMRGMAHYLDSVSQEAFYHIGHSIFGSELLSLKEKEAFFAGIGKKMLTLQRTTDSDISNYDTAAALNHVYRFIHDYMFNYGDFDEVGMQQIAFFPGTFDPFSQGHKEIVREIRKRGFEVYLALDEFSWSKRTQPFKVRRKILQMSIADLKDTYLFPTTIPINIANPDNMDTLRRIFRGKKVYLVMGSDVVANASAYQKEENSSSVHQMNHVIFHRGSMQNDEKVKNALAKIHGECVYVELPEDYQNISSTRIRNNLDSNRDISNLVDKNVQNYLYDKDLYTREPLYKKELTHRPISFGRADMIDPSLAAELREGLLKGTRWEHDSSLEKQHIIYIRNQNDGNRITGAVLFHKTKTAGLWDECENQKLVSYLRDIVSGSLVVISGLYGIKASGSRQTVLAELLARSLEKEYSYALCFDYECDDNRQLLEKQGFVSMEPNPMGYLVDLRKPMVLYYDKEMNLKEEFEENANVQETLRVCHDRLQHSLIKLFPGHLLLTLESDVLQYHLIQEITMENNVPVLPRKVRQLGEKMCVPYGAIMRGIQIPNTVTKALRTEKYISPDMDRLIIKEMPGYADIETQIRTIKAFGRPVIMTDDYYHKGHRMAKINRYLKEENVEVSKVIVGVMTGNGRDLARLRGRAMQWVYFVPNMRTWVTESDFYPFIGGEGVYNDKRSEHEYSTIPSVNPILPYRDPFFFTGCDFTDFYSLSEVCLKNAKEIWSTLEKEFRKKYHRKLTIGQLSEVLKQPRVPDVAIGNFYDEYEAPSVYIQYELDRLARLQPGVKSLDFTIS